MKKNACFVLWDFSFTQYFFFFLGLIARLCKSETRSCEKKELKSCFLSVDLFLIRIFCHGQNKKREIYYQILKLNEASKKIKNETLSVCVKHFSRLNQFMENFESTHLFIWSLCNTLGMVSFHNFYSSENFSSLYNARHMLIISILALLEDCIMYFIG